VAPRVKTVGFFSNNKQNAAEIQASLAGWLGRSYGVATRTYRKLNASVPADPRLIDQIVAECDAVVTGSGDCGSCTSSAVHDSHTLRRRGLPVAMLATTSFVGLAEMQAHALGADDIDLIVVTHPIGGITPAELSDRCQEAIREMTSWWQTTATEQLLSS
jgi:hypothetical protein